MTRIEDLGPWPARVAWILVAVAGQAAVADALSSRSTPVAVLAWAMVGVGWTAGLVALLVPRTSSLTAVRVVVPGGLATAAWAVSTGETVDWADLLALSAAAVALVATTAPWFTEAWVDGSSYGAERRIPLQTPPVIGLVAVLTWSAMAASAVAGPFLLATGRWVPGTVAVAVGSIVIWRGWESLHQLSRRWVVLVPNGMVVHDPLTLPEPHLFLRTSITAVHPAGVGTDALDLTAGASGLALEVAMDGPVDLLVRDGGREPTTIQRTALLITPSRPARFLDHLRSHRIPVTAPRP